MHLQRNFYEVLGLPTSASTDDIKKKYRELARKFHPDLVEDKALGQRIFTQVNQAYRVLRDTDRRAQYDATLNAPIRSPGVMRSGSTVATGNGVDSPQNGSYVKPQAGIDKAVRDADMAMMNGQASTARSLCEGVLKVDPENTQAHSLLGDALAQLKKTDEAMKSYRRALSIAPSSIVQAKLSRLQAVKDQEVEMAVLSQKSANGTRHGKNEPAQTGTGLFGRLLKRK